MDTVRRTSSGTAGSTPRQYYVAVGSADVKLVTCRNGVITFYNI